MAPPRSRHPAELLRSGLVPLSVFLGCCQLARAPAPAALPLLFTKANATGAKPHGLRDGGSCQVLFLDAREDAFLPNGQPLDLRRFDAVLTDAHDLVPWASSRPPLHYIDDTAYPHQAGRELYERKRTQRTFSVLVPSRPQSAVIERLSQEALAVMPGDVYVDDGTPASRRPAFEAYAFALLLSMDSRVPSPVFLESIAYSAVPMLVWDVPHFINYTVYSPYAVAKFRPDQFSIMNAVSFLQKAHEDAVYVLQNSLMLVQDFFYFRYSLPFHLRAQLYATRICEEAALPVELHTDVFIAIYSAKANFARRSAARETWLSLLEGPVEGTGGGEIVAVYKFFLNAVGAGDPLDPASSPLDDIIRSEAETFGDLVFLEAVEDYPIGYQGLLALRWIANHTAAPYVLKVDDDMYIRPLPLLRLLVQQQRAMMYWGFFERSGMVVRDPENAHYLPPDLFGHDGVFPPYARGAALAFSLDLVRLIAHFDRLGMLRRLKIEDASYGYFLWQLVVLGVTSVTLADREEAHFALDAKCCTEQSHPNNCWSALGDKTWIVHHVGPRSVRCMFRTDVEAGYYSLRQARSLGRRGCLAAAVLSQMLPGDDAQGGLDGAPVPCTLNVAGGPAADAQQAYDPKRLLPLPSLCGCVHTPPPHPGQPKPGPLHEGPDGPRLHRDEQPV